MVPSHEIAGSSFIGKAKSRGNPTLAAMLSEAMILVLAQIVLSDTDERSLDGAQMARKYSKKASKKVERAMHERKRGKLRSGRSGKKVTSRKQAIAIGLSEARRSGAKVPNRRRRKSSSRRKSSARRRRSSGSRTKRTSKRRA